MNDTFDPGVTAELLVDGGVENMNRGVDELVERGLLQRVLAMVDISVSNSLIEAWWRALKHNWLFLQPMDTAATVRREVAFYVEEHNRAIPHSAFKGQTPDEIYFGKGDGVPDPLAEARAEARERRMEATGHGSAPCVRDDAEGKIVGARPHGRAWRRIRGPGHRRTPDSPGEGATRGRKVTAEAGRSSGLRMIPRDENSSRFARMS